MAVLATPAALMATQITLTQNSNYSFGDGGEFTAVTTGQSFLGNGYVPSTLVSTKSGQGFETFCVESTVTFNPGETYNYTLSTTGVDSVGQALTEGAAYLYYEFATGNLSKYTYTPGSGRSTTADQLQAAIWYLMGGQLGNGYTKTSILQDQFYKLALSVLGGNLDVANNGTYGVDILELTDVNNSKVPAQNQLVLTGVPPKGNLVPDNFTTVIFVGASMAGLFLVEARRRQVVAKQS